MSVMDTQMHTQSASSQPCSLRTPQVTLKTLGYTELPLFPTQRLVCSRPPRPVWRLSPHPGVSSGQQGLRCVWDPGTPGPALREGHNGWPTPTVGCRSALKRGGNSGAREGVVLSDVSQTRKDKHGVVPLTRVPRVIRGTGTGKWVAGWGQGDRGAAGKMGSPGDGGGDGCPACGCA